MTTEIQTQSVSYDSKDKIDALRKEAADAGFAQTQSRLQNTRRSLANDLRKSRVAGSRASDRTKLVGTEAGKTLDEVMNSLAKRSDEISILAQWVSEQDKANMYALQAEADEKFSYESDEVSTSVHQTNGMRVFDAFAAEHPETIKTLQMDQSARRGQTMELSRPQSATLIRSGFITPQVIRSGHMQLDPLNPPALIDIMPMVSSNSGGYKYLNQTKRIVPANGGAVAENAAYAETDAAFEEKTISVQKLTATLKMTDEQIADEAGARSFVNAFLPGLMRHQIETHTINGAGTGSEWTGLLASTHGITKTDATGDEDTALLENFIDAYATIGTSGRDYPTFVAMPVATFTTLAKTKDDDKRYLISDPADKTMPRIWGLPIVIANELPAGTALVGTHNQFALLQAGGLEMAWGWDGEDFTHGRETVRMSIRGNVIVFRKESFQFIENIGS